MKNSILLIALGLLVGIAGSIIFDVSWHFNRPELTESQARIYSRCRNSMKANDVEFADRRSLSRGCHCVALETAERSSPKTENDTISLMGSYIKYHRLFVINYGLVSRKTANGKYRFSQHEIQTAREEWKQILKENHPGLSGSLMPHRWAISSAFNLCGKVRL